LGFSCGDITISIEQMESSEWGAQFESHDKEFNEAVKGLSGKLL
jgi:phenylpyruvate tautomerase PptA (4-oxalocrotonate tautomerase family)